MLRFTEIMFKECIPDPRNTEKTISKCTGWCTPLDYPVEGSKGTGIVHEWHQNTSINPFYSFTHTVYTIGYIRHIIYLFKTM